MSCPSSPGAYCGHGFIHSPWQHLEQGAPKNLDQDQRMGSAGPSSVQFARFGKALRDTRLLAAGLRRTAACNFLFPGLRLMIGR
jgi:hypothetical protein